MIITVTAKTKASRDFISKELLIIMVARKVSDHQILIPVVWWYPCKASKILYPNQDRFKKKEIEAIGTGEVSCVPEFNRASTRFNLCITINLLIIGLLFPSFSPV
jgi:hypothetical protein